jgi:hypothetical protein
MTQSSEQPLRSGLILIWNEISIRRNILKKYEITEEFLKAKEMLSEIEGTGKNVQTDIKAGVTCKPWSCPRPLYGVGTGTLS